MEQTHHFKRFPGHCFSCECRLERGAARSACPGHAAPRAAEGGTGFASPLDTLQEEGSDGLNVDVNELLADHKLTNNKST